MPSAVVHNGTRPSGWVKLAASVARSDRGGAGAMRGGKAWADEAGA